MLHIVKQFMFGLTVGIKLNNSPEGTIGGETISETAQEKIISPEVKDSIEANEVKSNTMADLKELYNEVEVAKLEAADFLISEISDKELKNKDYNSSDVQKMQTALKMLGMNISIDGDFGTKTATVIEKLQGQLGLDVDGIFNTTLATKLSSVIQSEIVERKVIISTIKEVKIGDSSENKNLSNGIQEFKQKESGNHISTGMRNETIFQKGEMTREEAISHMNITSLESLLRTHSAAEIVKAISEGTDKYEEVLKDENEKPLLDAKGKEITETRLDFNVFGGYTQAEKWLEHEDRGYDSDGGFGGLEMNSIYTYAVEIMRNQETAKNNTPEGKFKQLIDFDGNGFLTTDKNFYIGELQAEYLNQTDKVGTFENLYKNLGLNQAELETEMTTNYFTAQEKFEQRLSTYLQMGIKPGELFIEGGLEKAVNQLYDDTNEELETVKDYEAEVLFIKGAVLKELVNKTNGKIPNLEVQAEAIALESIHAVVGGAKGLAANFNISRFTNDLVRDLTVGVVNGKPGVMISRGFFEKQLDKYDIAVSGGLLNIVIPIVTVSADVFNEEFPDADVVNGTGDDYKISLFASASTIGQAVGVQYTESSFETSTGIEELGSKLGEQLDKMIDVLNSVATANGAKNSENPVQVKLGDPGLDTQEKVDAANKLYDNYFSVLQNIDMSLTNRKKEKSAFNNAKQAIVNGYTDKLYRNIDEKINFASVGAGVAFAADILPVPFVTASFERVKTHFEEQNHSNERERRNTEKSIQVNIEKFNNFDAITFDNNYAISVPEDYPLQGNIEGNKLYIGGDIQSIRVHEHVNNNQVVRTVVINEGHLNEEGIYETTKIMSDINSNVNISKSEIYKNTLLEASNNTSEVRENINILFSNDTLFNGSTTGAIALQKEIYNYVNGDSKKNIGEIFTQLNTLVGKNMLDYAKNKGLENNLLDLQVALNKIDTTNETQLLAILQSVNANFMEKEALTKNSDNIVSMDKTIHQYDKDNNRADFFDKAFETKYKNSDFTKNIQDARAAWMAINGDKTKYNFTPSEGNLAMTGVMLGRSQMGVMSYEGVYNIAQPEGGKAYVSLKNNPEYINNLPDSFIKNIQTQLQNVGVELKTLEEVKEYINNGGDSRANINYELAFARMGECLNDAIILKDFSIKAPTKTVSSLTSTMNTQDQNVKTFGITLVDNVREKNKLEEADVESEPTEGSNGDVDENGEATGSDNTNESEGGWTPGGDVEIIDVETAQNINTSTQKNIKNIVPNIVHIGNDAGKTGKNMNNN